MERTGSEITLDSFYKKLPALSLKEKWIYITTSFVLRNVSHLVVNTEWLSKILSDGYVYDTKKTTCIENYFAGVQMCPETMQHTYVAASRAIKLKNKDRLKKVRNAMKHPPISLIDTSMSQNDLHEIVTQCHATAVVSFSEVSPNLVLEGVARGKPFIVTKHTGLHPRFASMGFFVDPFDEDSIRQGFHALSDESQYKRYLAAIEDCTYIHTWDVIGSKFEKLLI